MNRPHPSPGNTGRCAYCCDLEKSLEAEQRSHCSAAVKLAFGFANRSNIACHEGVDADLPVALRSVGMLGKTLAVAFSWRCSSRDSWTVHSAENAETGASLRSVAMAIPAGSHSTARSANVQVITDTDGKLNRCQYYDWPGGVSSFNVGPPGRVES